MAHVQREPFPLDFMEIIFNFASGWIKIAGGSAEDALIPAEDSVSDRLSHLARWSRLKGPVRKRLDL